MLIIDDMLVIGALTAGILGGGAAAGGYAAGRRRGQAVQQNQGNQNLAPQNQNFAPGPVGGPNIQPWAFGGGGQQGNQAQNQGNQPAPAPFVFIQGTINIQEVF